jgi:hypothetical protein
MLKYNTTKKLTRALFELEKNYFETNNSYSTIEHTERWADYTDIISQFIAYNHPKYVFELYYRATNGENINTVLTELINRDNELYLILYPFKHKLKEYQNFDQVKIFL